MDSLFRRQKKTESHLAREMSMSLEKCGTSKFACQHLPKLNHWLSLIQRQNFSFTKLCPNITPNWKNTGSKTPSKVVGILQPKIQVSFEMPNSSDFCCSKWLPRSLNGLHFWSRNTWVAKPGVAVASVVSVAPVSHRHHRHQWPATVVRSVFLVWNWSTYNFLMVI